MSRPRADRAVRTIVVLAGLPGTGKSRLGAELARVLHAPILDKDTIRAEMFGPDRIEYSRTQDDACCREMHARAEELFASGARVVVLDGRTYSKRYQVDDLEAFATRIDVDLAWIECTADAELVRERLENDARRGVHTAGNRGFALYLTLSQSAEPIEREKLVVDTGIGGLEEHVALCVEWLKGRGVPGRRRS